MIIFVVVDEELFLEIQTKYQASYYCPVQVFDFYTCTIILVNNCWNLIYNYWDNIQFSRIFHKF